MTASQIIGPVATLYGVGGAFAVLLQARQMLDRGTSCDLPAGLFPVHVGGYAIWRLGIGLIQDGPLRLIGVTG
jgi:hypothetical protein